MYYHFLSMFELLHRSVGVREALHLLRTMSDIYDVRVMLCVRRDERREKSSECGRDCGRGPGALARRIADADAQRVGSTDYCDLYCDH